MKRFNQRSLFQNSTPLRSTPRLNGFKGRIPETLITCYVAYYIVGSFEFLINFGIICFLKNGRESCLVVDF